MKLFMHLSVIFMIFILISCTNQTKTNEEIIKKNITSYLTAVESKDISEMIKYADDIRFPNKQEQKYEYENIPEIITETNLEKLEKVTETKYQATIKYKKDDDGTPSEITFPVIKKDNDWRIIVGQEVGK